MKTLLRSNRMLIVFLTLFGLVAHVDDVSGQWTGCHNCGTSTSCNGSAAIGNCAFGAGESANASGALSVCIGYKSASAADSSLTFGNLLGTNSSNTNNMVLGFGNSPSQLLSNGISNSIMIGANSTIPTMFFEDAGGSGLGNVGVGLTTPLALLHVEAAAAGTEEIARFSVAGISNETNYFRIQNTSGTSGEFGAMLKATNNTHSDGPTLMMKAVASATAVSGDDDPQAAIMQFDSRYSGASSGDSIKPLFVWTENNNGNSKMIIDSWGNVGIGENSPAGALEVKGTVFVDYSSLPAGSITGGGPPATDYIVGIKSTTGQLLNLGASSIQFKEEVENIEFDKEAFLQLRPVDFKWKEFYGGHMDVGLVAQEVEETFPALASFAYKRTFLPNGDFERDSLGNAVEDTSQLEAGGVRYHKLAVYLLALAKDQQLEIDALQTQTETLITMVQNCCGEPSYRMGDLDENGMVVKTGNGVEEYVLLNNDPNPFSDYTDIHYAKDDCQNCEIVITDINGRIVKRIQLATSNGTVRVYASEIGRGMFIYSLIKDGQVVRSERMASTK